MNIIFMGSGSFAIPSLVSLISKHNVQAVFSQPPKPAGRSLKPRLCPIHKVANYYGINVYTPKRLRNYETIELIKSIKAEVIVVCSYGLIITTNILAAKKYGCLNIHPSSLPKYRGAAPLQRAIIDGEKETSICIMQMDENLDTGDIILGAKYLIKEEIDFPTLNNQCAEIGAYLLNKVIQNIDTLKRTPQSTKGISYAKKLTKEEGKIDWHCEAFKIGCKLRGMTPWPGAFFYYKGEKIKVLSAKAIKMQHNFEAGYVINNDLEIACKKNAIKILALQRPGGKKLWTNEFLKGFFIPKGAILT